MRGDLHTVPTTAEEIGAFQWPRARSFIVTKARDDGVVRYGRRCARDLTRDSFAAAVTNACVETWKERPNMHVTVKEFGDSHPSWERAATSAEAATDLHLHLVMHVKSQRNTSRLAAKLRQKAPTGRTRTSGGGPHATRAMKRNPRACTCGSTA